ncbi:RluA family pseudouridine synthase [bacterium]|nr:RluA family pseudouridine synthase [Akkermansiaceae bacterium]MDA8972943.1 RluA family pseudouridine synthase [bacterium]MDA7538476.1 RluA family pseudouridine synthase [Akkermansiaceae bacterium]MDB0055629.1 RluA family pseudouridine synthase [Akkermansiaceae bacterium]MDB4275311.1 RluA family pseudouridine synthase [Akkermansiaceae bacterium]
MASAKSSNSVIILYQDEHIIVVNKPSGLLSTPGRGPEKIDSVSHRIVGTFPDCIAQPSVHRLDMDTSGLLVLAFTTEAHRHLSRQFQDRLTEKHYVALLEGILEDDEGTITLPFRLDVENRPHQIYDDVHGKIGITHWNKIGIEDGLTRIAFHPITGRTHQLRVHSAHEKGLGIPIVDDPLYGNGDEPGKMKLHASDLAFTHPETSERMSFSVPPPF